MLSLCPPQLATVINTEFALKRVNPTAQRPGTCPPGSGMATDQPPVLRARQVRLRGIGMLKNFGLRHCRWRVIVLSHTGPATIPAQQCVLDG